MRSGSFVVVFTSLGLAALLGCSTTRTYPLHPSAADARIGDLVPEPLRQEEELGALRDKHDLRFGDLTNEDLQPVLDAGHQDTFRCYQKVFEVRPRLEGLVALRIAIGPDGAVAGTRVLEDTVEVRALTACMREKISSWKFPAPKGGDLYLLNYPFEFRLRPGGHWLAIPSHERKEM